MSVAVATCAGLLFLTAVVEAALGIWFAIRVSRAPRAVIRDDDLPQAAVILAIRGSDDELRDTLASLVAQDYPRYTVHMVVDHGDESAWAGVHDALSSRPADHVFVEPLVEVLPNCSLKCSAMRQAARSLPATVRMIATCDADSRPPRWWLRELAAALQAPDCGLVFGNRWYAPENGQFGSQVRVVWNSFVAVAMALLRTPWAGSMAMRAEDYHRLNVEDLWSRVVSDDAPLRELFLSHAYKLRCVPALVHLDRGEVSFSAAFDYMVRQLTNTRLYAPRAWRYVILLSIAFVGPLAAALLVGCWAMLSSMPAAAASCFGGLLAFHINALAVFTIVHQSVLRSQRMPRAPWRVAFIQALCAAALIPFVEFLHLLAVVAAQWRRSITWRGVTYDIQKPDGIRISHDKGAWRRAHALATQSVGALRQHPRQTANAQRTLNSDQCTTDLRR